MNRRIVVFLRPAIAAVFAVVCINTAAFSMEGGQSPALRGYRDFMTGVLPPNSLLVRQDFYLYSGTERSTIPQGQLRVNLRSAASILGVTAVTPYRVLGGDYGVAVRLAVSDVTADQTISRPGVTTVRGGTLTGLNDIVFTPVLVGWRSGNYHWNIGGSVWVPAGNYDKNRAVNTGKNYWSASPNFGLTYFDPKSGWEVSAAAIYVINFENTATHYHSGDLAQLDYAIGRALTPQFKLGLAGYLAQQVTSDSGSGATLGARKLRAAGIGPAAVFTFLVNKVPVNLVAKYYREFDAQNTTQGDSGTVSFRVKF